VQGHLLDFSDFDFANTILGTMMSKTKLTRSLCEVTLEDGTKEQAITYFGKDLSEDEHGFFIEHGNWQQDQDENKLSYKEVVDGLIGGKYKNIMVMTGAGISVSAGIPDFRSPKTGVYANLKEYDLPRPEAIFDIEYFVDKPEAFYKFMVNFDLTKHSATPTHYFIKMLHEKKLLFKNMTQNIDNLEEKTGIDMDMVIQAHGANRGAHCSKCKKKKDAEEMAAAIQKQEVLRCKECQGPVKPDITFFGEGLPAEFMEFMDPDMLKPVDLLIVMGTALAVGPFNQLPLLLKATVPKLLFNLDNTKDTGTVDFCTGANNLFVPGKCDETIAQLCKDVKWWDDFQKVLPDKHKETEEKK